ncbi:Na/Pi cotransporter family protein [Pannonibacter sp. SL95]|uniref:Na/Pi cotransporter family protein n=1 Tax=Pannonibacter sp. SL95 TaxID=2995153 RepID=UPI0022747A53|nr:Na/Pi cotransporter family protein [Pannonibacter sp. SL95]MCY1706642.1 Na/Pi cotransporter family protein [Pannonibacter sp. SL95]
MHPFLILLHLAAAVMLLLWAVRMVRTGIERAYGPALRNAMRHARGGTPGMAAAGVVLAIVLQSATAVGVLAVGFCASSIIGVGTGIAALLGADLGSALVVKLLSFDLSELIPGLMLVGATLFLKFESRQVRQIGRITLGIAFILLSLQLVGQATAPARQSEVLPQIAGYLAGDPLMALAVSALIAWGLHSSVATLILFASFAANGVLPVEAAAPMVLGANVGGGLVAVWLTRGAALPARRIPLGNLIFRCVAAAIALVALQLFPALLGGLGGSPAVQLVNFHVAFNLCLVVAALPFIRPMERLTARLWPVPAQEMQETATYRSALDRSTTARPVLALASAQRELLRMGEAVEAMLRPVLDMLDAGDPLQIGRLRAMDQEVNRRHTDIKLFIADVNRGSLSADEARRSLELASLAIDFEAMGDIIAKNLLTQAEEMSRLRLRFSREGWGEIQALHARVLVNMHMALNVLVSSDLESARQLAAEKSVLRRMERESHDRHLARLRAGAAETLDTSDIHLEVVRALKEVNSLLVKVAYPILSEQGYLRDTRLVEHV